MTVGINYAMNLLALLFAVLMTAALICKVIQYYKSLPGLENETELMLGAFLYS